ncbi:hypothetical protein F2P81_015255 [Scophthalmus maximus]|uniref:Uncharacterized protein n=1 Tax=Scophthalmus maximus TaxID=52904 RepID=A0A6A4SKA9_SCOMX|nr:hypothetical protein F2P81_015255 [Scophthalmus maximus]
MRGEFISVCRVPESPDVFTVLQRRETDESGGTMDELDAMLPYSCTCESRVEGWRRCRIYVRRPCCTDGKHDNPPKQFGDEVLCSSGHQ